MTTLTPIQIAELVEFGEGDAIENSTLCAPLEFARATRLAVKRIGSLQVLTIPKLDTPFFNRILGLGVGEPATESKLDEAIAFFQDAGCNNYMAQVSPLAKPDHCPEWLIARGFKQGRNWAKMLRGNEPAPVIPTDLRLEQVGKEQADAFGDLVITTFEMPAMLHSLMAGSVSQPGWSSYLAYAGDKPVSCASMHVNGEVAWLGNMGTLNQFRKRGAQGALFARCIQDGLALGCRWFVTETGEDTPQDPNPSFHNMLRSGFKLAYLRRNYIHQMPAGPLHFNEWGRALFVAAHNLKFKWQRLWQ